MNLSKKGRSNKPGKYVKSSDSVTNDKTGSTNRSNNDMKNCHK